MYTQSALFIQHIIFQIRIFKIDYFHDLHHTLRYFNALLMGGIIFSDLI